MLNFKKSTILIIILIPVIGIIFYLNTSTDKDKKKETLKPKTSSKKETIITEEKMKASKLSLKDIEKKMLKSSNPHMKILFKAGLKIEEEMNEKEKILVSSYKEFLALKPTNLKTFKSVSYINTLLLKIEKLENITKQYFSSHNSISERMKEEINKLQIDENRKEAIYRGFVTGFSLRLEILNKQKEAYLQNLKDLKSILLFSKKNFNTWEVKDNKINFKDKNLKKEYKTLMDNFSKSVKKMVESDISLYNFNMKIKNKLTSKPQSN